jgi:glycosyltransferase involved in cell wall biosynthesis
MKRIIFAWNYSEWGGAQIYFLALIKDARKHFEPIVILPQNTDPQFINYLTRENVRYEMFSGSMDLAPKSRVFEKLGRHITRIKSEYAMLRKIREVGLEDTNVHTDISPGQSLFSLIWLAMRTHVFVTHHNAQPLVPTWRRLIWRFKFGVISRFKSFHVFVSNRHAAEYYRELYVGSTASNLKITYTTIHPPELDGVLDDDFDRDAILEQLGVKQKWVILTVGQFIDRKGRWTLLEAIRRIVRKCDDIAFIWLAPSLPSDDEIEKISDFGLEEVFRLIKSSDIGNDRNSILRFFRVADVFALPSFVEGVPIALLEAMGMGVASVSTCVNGIPEAIIHEQTGLLIEPGDAVALERAIIRLISDRDLRTRLATNGKLHVREIFDERKMTEIAINEYRSIDKEQ